jgi:putative membrane protein
MKTSVLTSLIAAATLVALPATIVCAVEPAPVTQNDAAADGRFMENATQSNLAEIKFSELAKDRTKRADVKDLATKLSEDHTGMQKNLKSLADGMNIKLTDKITAEQQAAFDLLKQANAADFDRMFVDTAVASHKKGIALYEAFSNSTKHAGLKAYADTHLPHLKMHLQKAEELAKTIKAVAAVN